MSKTTTFAVFIIILGLGVWYWSVNLNSNTSSDVSQTIAETQESKQVNESSIALRVSKPVVKLGESFQVTWDISKIPANAKGVGLHIVRPDGGYISATGVGGLDPAIGSYELTIPTEFYGFVNNGNYYVQALVTDIRNSNGYIVASGSANFKIVSSE